MFYQEWPLFTQPDINTWYLYVCINSTLSQGCAVLKCSRKPILCYITQHVLKTSIQCLKTPDYLLRKIGVKIILRITPYICYFPCDIMTHPSPSDSNDLITPYPWVQKITLKWGKIQYQNNSASVVIVMLPTTNVIPTCRDITGWIRLSRTYLWSRSNLSNQTNSDNEE